MVSHKRNIKIPGTSQKMTKFLQVQGSSLTAIETTYVVKAPEYTESASVSLTC